MKLRKILFPVLILMLALALVACGGGESPADAPADSDTSAGETAEEAGGGEEEVVSAGDPAAGEELYNSNCIACHGEGGTGIEGLGKPFTTSEFVHGQSDEDLLAFIKQGRPISDPENTTGVDMPPKGGNPALTDEQILDIIAYLRTLEE
jgi:disulfide bond formation protein DsbB